MKYQVERWQCYRWERHDGRYYCANIEQDLLGEWVVRCYWGGKERPAGRILSTVCEDYKQALEQLLVIARKRQKRNYITA